LGAKMSDKLQLIFDTIQSSALASCSAEYKFPFKITFIIIINLDVCSNTEE
jgi:hypothetical protein